MILCASLAKMSKTVVSWNGCGDLFRGVLLPVGVSAAQLVLHPVSVLQLLDLINPDQPVL